MSQRGACGAGNRPWKIFKLAGSPRAARVCWRGSRELVVTNGYAANACEAFASNLVGGEKKNGIQPSSH